MAGSSNKLFVGGLPQSCSDDILINYFQQYGKITDSVVMKDRITGHSRGFGFVTYEDTSSVDMVMDRYEDHRMNDKWVEVKRATPQDQMPPGSGSKGKGGGKGGGDRGGGGGGGRQGDWTCTGCGANVFASKDTCFKCGAEKPRGGGGGGGGAPPPAGYGPAPGGMPMAAYGAYGAPPPAGAYGYSPYGAPPAGYGAYGGMPQYPAYGAPPQGYSPYGPAYGAPPQGYSAPPPQQAPPGGPALPPGWEQSSDPTSGTPYYYNRGTGETTWTRPQ